jgi:tripartite motif-containing protein 71
MRRSLGLWRWREVSARWGVSGALALIVFAVLLSAASSAAAETYAQAVEATADLAHFWPMGESSGSSLGDVAGEAPATIGSGVTLGEAGGLVGDASTSAAFDGSSGAASASVNLSGTHELTVEFWLKWSSYAADDRLALELTPNFNEYPGGLLVDPDATPGSDFAVAIGSGSSRNTVYFERPSAGVWHYYTFVLDTEASAETQITPYVDGKAVSYTKTVSGTGAGSFAESTLFWMSRDASSLFGAGAMQDLALYAGKLSLGTIQHHYEIGEGGPHASFASLPVDATVGVPVRLDASGSTSPVGTITDYAWDFDGGKGYGTDRGSSSTVSHTFSSPGTYTVDLQVTDGTSSTATVSHTITVGAALGEYEQEVEDTAGIAHFWPMGEATGSSFADIVEGADAEVLGGVTLGEPGGTTESTTGALFDGSSGAARANVDLSGTSKVTVEFWLKWSAFAEDDHLAMELTPNFNEDPGGFLIDPDASGSGRFGVGLGLGETRNNAFFERPSAEHWHYYAFTLDTTATGASEIKPYVDGHPISYTRGSEGVEAGAFAKSVLYWMSRGAGSLFGEGAMQDVALYEGVLSKTTILHHYEIGAGIATEPTASFGSLPVSATAGVPVELDASASSSPAGTLSDYAWDFDGGKGYATDKGGTPTESHTFSAPGTYTVDLRVEDENGASGTVSHTITVGSALPAYDQAVEKTAGISNYWPMGEASGSSLADVFGGADATTAGGITLGEPGGLLADSAAASVAFDGSSGAASAAVDLSGTHELTVEFWMKWASYAPDDRLALEFTPNFNEHAGGLLVDPDATPGSEFAVSIGQGGSRNTVFFERPSAGAWHYYTFVIDTEASAETEITPYVDGKAVSYSKSETGTGAGNFANSTLYWMSRDASSLFGHGDMQDLALYTGALSASTVEHHYELGTATLTNTVAPSITGTAQEGQTLAASPGNWTGAEPITYAYQWERCGEAEEECINISGATGTSYLLGPKDVGSLIRVSAIASDAGGTATGTSGATAAVAAGLGASLQFGSLGLGEGQFDQPGDVKIDAKGDLWVLDSGNDQVQEFNEHGEYLEEFGAEGSENGQLNHPDGLAIDLSDNLWIADTGNDRVEEFNEHGEYLRSVGSSGSGTGQLTAPEGIAIDPHGNLWVSDTGNARIEVFSESGEYLKTVGSEGSEAGRLAEPEGIAIDSEGNAWVADFTGAHIDEFDEEGEFVRTLGSEGSGPGQLENPDGVAIGESGDIWVGDVGDDRVTEYDNTGAYLQRFGSPGMESGQFGLTAPMGLAVDQAGSVWIADSANNRVEQWTPVVAPSNLASPAIVGAPFVGQTLSARNGSWSGSGPIAFDYLWKRCDSGGGECEDVPGATKATYVLSEGDREATLRVTVTASNPGGVFSSTSSQTAEVTSGFGSGLVYSSQFGSEGSAAGQFSRPSAVAAGANGALWVADRNNDRVEEFNNRGEYVTSVGENGSSSLNHPNGVALDAEGDIWVLDSGHSRVEEFDEQGEYITKIEPQEPGPGELGVLGGIAVDARGNIWVSNPEGGQLKEFDSQGGYIETVEGAGANKLSKPEGVAVDSHGNVWVADATANRVEEFDEEGTYLSQFGSSGSGEGKLSSPYAVAVGPDGDVWVGDVGNNRIEEFSEGGEYLYQFGSSGAEAGKFKFQAPIGIAVDASGDLWVADSKNNRIQELTPPALAPTNDVAPSVFGEPYVGETLSALPGRWSGLPPLIYTYQWQQCGAGGGGCIDIAEATNATYALTEADSGTTIKVVITASNREGSNISTSEATPGISVGTAPTSTLQPAISGTPQDGQTLNASSGTWTGTSPLAYTYQWERCNVGGEECTIVEGATGPEYLQGQADVGSTLRVVASASNVAGSAEAASSPTTAVEAEAPSELQAPSITGVPDVHQVLYANVGVWAGTGRRLSYQWEICSSSGEGCAPIDGATDPEYDLTEDDSGSTIRVRIGVSSALGAVTDVSPLTPVIGAAGDFANMVPPAITGTVQAGGTLKASKGDWSGKGSIGYAYQWQNCESSGLHCEDIEGATNPEYALEVGDIGNRLRVVVSATDETGTVSSASADTQPIAAAHAPVLGGAPAIVGTALQGYTLTATEGTWSAEGSVTYGDQWERCNTSGGECAAIEGATSGTYTIAGADVESVVRVVVSATNAEGTSTGVSHLTAAIGPESLQEFSSPSISGAVQVGGSLDAHAAIWSGSGPISYAYQWERCNTSGAECSAIEGATEATYVVVSGDLGSTLRVAVTLTNPSGSDSAHSAHTPIVPGGEQSVSEVEEVAQLTDPALLESSTTATLEEQTVSPGLHDDGEELVSTGSLTSSNVSKEAPGEFAVNTPVGLLSVTPLETPENATTNPTIVNGTVALFANTWSATDTVVRPDALGATTILQLRSSESPSSFTWQVQLGASQELKQLSDGSVAVINASETGSELEPEQLSQEPKTLADAPEGEPETSAEESEREEEEARPESEEEVPLESLPAAPVSSVSPAETPPGQMEPQDVSTQYEAAAAAVSVAETQTGGQTLMVIHAPTVTDAAGKTVPASLQIHGDNLTLIVKPTGVMFPVMAALTIAGHSDKTNATQHPVHYGLADDTLEAFLKFDPNLKKTTAPLHVTTARLVIPYDTFYKPREGRERERLGKWLSAAKSDHLKTYVTVGKDYGCKGASECLPPSPSEYRARFTEIFNYGMERGVRLWGAWNEPDLKTDPLHKLPRRAAKYWQEAQSVATKSCSSCRVVAGEFAFVSPTWKTKYIEEYRDELIYHRHPCQKCWRGKPSIWGIHDYHDVSADGREYAEKFRDFTRMRMRNPQIIVSEVAVELENKNEEHTSLDEGNKVRREKLQRRAASDLLRLSNASSRIEKVYYYEYRAPSEAEVEKFTKDEEFPFDSGLFEAKPEPDKSNGKVTSKGEARPVYCYLAFASHSCAPTVVTVPVATGLGEQALVTPNGRATRVYFQRSPQGGMAGEYTVTGKPQAIGVGLAPVEVGVQLGCGPFHFRAIAINASRTTRGNDEEDPNGCS